MVHASNFTAMWQASLHRPRRAQGIEKAKGGLLWNDL
jgi:hypothetical protein